VSLQSQAILDPNITLEVISDNVEYLEHVMVDDEEQSDFAGVGIFSCRPLNSSDFADISLVPLLYCTLCIVTYNKHYMSCCTCG
jgi:hypothetical protein